MDKKFVDSKKVEEERLKGLQEWIKSNIMMEEILQSKSNEEYLKTKKDLQKEEMQ